MTIQNMHERNIRKSRTFQDRALGCLAKYY
jgi:hypothetical protein